MALSQPPNVAARTARAGRSRKERAMNMVSSVVPSAVIWREEDRACKKCDVKGGKTRMENGRLEKIIRVLSHVLQYHTIPYSCTIWYDTCMTFGMVVPQCTYHTIPPPPPYHSIPPYKTPKKVAPTQLVKSATNKCD